MAARQAPEHLQGWGSMISMCVSMCERLHMRRGSWRCASRCVCGGVPV